MKTSEEGVDLIKHFEGLRTQAYQDMAGIWTIGWGHTGKGAQPGFKITIAAAEDLLRRDIATAEKAVLAATAGTPLTQGQLDALVSFVFNLGAGQFNKSTLLARIRAGDMAGAAKQFLRWTKARVGKELIEVPGLLKRRTAEMELFRKKA